MAAVSSALLLCLGLAASVQDRPEGEGAPAESLAPVIEVDAAAIPGASGDSRHCPEGHYWDGGRCSSYSVHCPDGYTWEEQACRDPDFRTPAEAHIYALQAKKAAADAQRAASGPNPQAMRRAMRNFGGTLRDGLQFRIGIAAAAGFAPVLADRRQDSYVPPDVPEAADVELIGGAGVELTPRFWLFNMRHIGLGASARGLFLAGRGTHAGAGAGAFFWVGAPSKVAFVASWSHEWRQSKLDADDPEDDEPILTEVDATYQMDRLGVGLAFCAKHSECIRGGNGSRGTLQATFERSNLPALNHPQRNSPWAFGVEVLGRIERKSKAHVLIGLESTFNQAAVGRVVGNVNDDASNIGLIFKLGLDIGGGAV